MSNLFWHIFYRSDIERCDELIVLRSLRRIDGKLGMHMGALRSPLELKVTRREVKLWPWPFGTNKCIFVSMYHDEKNTMTFKTSLEIFSFKTYLKKNYTTIWGRLNLQINAWLMALKTTPSASSHYGRYSFSSSSTRGRTAGVIPPPRTSVLWGLCEYYCKGRQKTIHCPKFWVMWMYIVTCEGKHITLIFPQKPICTM